MRLTDSVRAALDQLTMMRHDPRIRSTDLYQLAEPVVTVSCRICGPGWPCATYTAAQIRHAARIRARNNLK